MKNRNLTSYLILFAVVCFLLAGVNCSTKGDGKIPVTTSSKNAREYYLEGLDLFEKLRFQESRQYFEKAIEEDTNFALAYLLSANVQPSVKGLFEKLDKAVALADKVSEGERLWILGFKAAVEGLPMKQREYFQQMVTAYPQDERAHTLLGNNYFAQQDYTPSIEEYNKAIQINPDYSQPYNQLGYAYRFLENYPEAEKAFKKYIELIPDDPNPYDSYAELLMKMGRFDESIETYRKA
ncbi:MAG: tetratricopeptide repeat protein, partial [candidate division Zixibacteria bacterium]|nr:tetratricopeptide repeat protein [candidate division Zixibacteria bacterium]